MATCQKPKQVRRASPAAKAKARQIKIIIDSSPDNLPTVAALEKKLGLEDSSLQRAFRELCGCTIAVYGRRAKLRRIKELLVDDTLTLDAIAGMTGYNAGAALSRFFKMMEGVSPGVWRRDLL
jgi:AraC-like DNA-binding protein